MASSIQLLRSTNPQERPFAGNLLEGQPAANLHSSEPGLFFKTTDGSVVKFGPAAITSDGSPPNSAPQGSAGNSVGELWLDKSFNPPVLRVYDGAQWVDAGSGGGGGGGAGSFLRWIYVASGGETSLSGTSGGVSLEYTAGLEEVFVNGVLITRGTDYSAINGTSITNLAPLTAGDVVTVLSMNPLETVQLPGQVTLLRWTILATAGQTVLSGIDSSSQQLAYTAGFEEVYVNGAFLRRGIDYTAVDGSSIIVSSPLAEDDEVTVMAWSELEIGKLSISNKDVAVNAEIAYSKLDLTDSIVDSDVAVNANIGASKLQFLQSGAGAGWRSVESKLRDTVSVKDFGALGSPTQPDVTANVQAAIDSLPAQGGTVFFPSGEYRISSALSVKAGVRLIGDGRASTTIRVTNNTANAINLTPGARFVVISNFTIRSTFGPTNSAIYIDPIAGAAENLFENLTVIGFNYAIRAEDLFWCNLVRYCKFYTIIGVSILDNRGLSIQNLFESVYFNQDGLSNTLAVELAAVYSTTFLTCNFGGSQVAGKFVRTTQRNPGVSFINCNFELQTVPPNAAAFEHSGRGEILYEGCTFWFIRQLNSADNSAILYGDGPNINVTIKSCDITDVSSSGPNPPVPYSIRSKNGCRFSVEQSPKFEDITRHEYLSGTSGYGRTIPISSIANPAFEGLILRKGGALSRNLVTQALATSYTWSSTSESILKCERAATPTLPSQSGLVSGTITVLLAGSADGQAVSAKSVFDFYLDNSGNETISEVSTSSLGVVTINLTLVRSGSNYNLVATPGVGAIASATVSVDVKYTKVLNDSAFDFEINLLK